MPVRKIAKRSDSKPARSQWVYEFHEGSTELKNLLGGKGAGLAEMTRLGLPVPPGFTISTDACRYYQEKKRLPPGFQDQLLAAVQRLEKASGRGFGDAKKPLLVSVRSGSVVSMPGMMDTVLNLGLNDETVKALAKESDDDAFAFDSYRRFLCMFSDIVLGIKKSQTDAFLEAAKEREEVKREIDLTPHALQTIATQVKALVRTTTKKPFPQNPYDQLERAILAVFESWNNPRAQTYRNEYKIPHDLGTAVNIQAMVFGNLAEDSATGVGFTRDPSTGESKLVGEFLPNSQGEDVVAGIRTPHPIADLKTAMPDAYAELERACSLVEKHYRDMQDVEFTIQNGKLWMLQTRSAKRTAQAALRVAVEMVKEGLIDREEAVTRIEPAQLDQLLHRRIDPAAKFTVLARGLNASPGAAIGQVVFHADDAKEWAEDGKKVILVRQETNPEDIHGFFAAQGILTSRGGMSSHAAVVARGIGKPCVSGAESIKVDEKKKQFRVGTTVVKEGDVVTLDGTTGAIILGEAPTIEPGLTPEFQTLLNWADSHARLEVRANADTPEMAQRAHAFGAVGIGLCRTERMFNAVERLPVVREMILAETHEQRLEALNRLAPMQTSDFREILRAMQGGPVTIRLLDPPLHEFLPMKDELLVEVTRRRTLGHKGAELERQEAFLAKVLELDEQNPMLGLRGCRLSILFPEIVQMQTRAIMQAACDVQKEGVEVRPEIMIPLVGHVNEFRTLRTLVVKEAKTVMAENDVQVQYEVGTMIELPRACLTADEIAREAQFFSFGTNDLTQTTFGYSRDDAEGAFLHTYHERGILRENPFEILDQAGVGKLVEMAVELGRKAKPKLKIGICGEHGGEPASIEFFHRAKLDYVSCSPFRVPVARLAAAHASIKERGRRFLNATV